MPSIYHGSVFKEEQEFYMVHRGGGRIMFILAAATNPDNFEALGSWNLIKELNLGRRAEPSVIWPGTKKECTCKGCAHCAEGGKCTKTKRTINTCYGCSPFAFEGCEFNHHANANHQWCNKGSQGKNTVGMNVCQEHSVKDLGLYVGDSLAQRVKCYAGNEVTLLMSEIQEFFDPTKETPNLMMRLRGAGNARILSLDEIVQLKEGQSDFLIGVARRILGMLLELYKTIGPDDWQRAWIQKVAVRFHFDLSVTVTKTDARLYNPLH
jgi:hypothetical protein